MGYLRRDFKRSSGERRYRKFYVIASEGINPERAYFEMLNVMLEKSDRDIRIKFISGGNNKSAPNQVLARMDDYIREGKMNDDDEAWLVIDKDQWPDEQLSQLHQWSQAKDNYNLAVNNPKFEYWLLLHFEDSSAITHGNCTDRLHKHLPDYDKRIDEQKVKPGIIAAIKRAKSRDVPACIDWPRNTGTTVYRLVECIMSEVENDNQ